MQQVHRDNDLGRIEIQCQNIVYITEQMFSINTLLDTNKPSYHNVREFFYTRHHGSDEMRLHFT